MQSRILSNFIVQCGVLLVCICYLEITDAQFLEGTVARCSNEGEEVYVPLISDDPCITCRCENSEVVCSRERCRDLNGCHVILFEKPKNSCCDVCRGCLYKGKQYASGTEWSNPDNHCEHFLCKAGVVTRSVRQCHAPCTDPVSIPGECCPVCKVCEMEGKRYEEGARFRPATDGCSECQCKNGSIHCEKRACPVLNCPAKYVYTEPGQCCPKCMGQRRVYDLMTRACLFRSRVHLNDRALNPDKCTACECTKGTMICSRRTCPVLNCSPEERVTEPGECCAKCVGVPRRSCVLQGKTYRHGLKWKSGSCTDCSCEDGTLRCQVQQCDNRLECPRNHRLQMVPGKCCPACVENDAVCVVFGDPHYRTFDGKIYNFQGTCNYILSEDCGNEKPKFSIRVRNDARRSNAFAWTKTVGLQIGRLRITLHQKLIVKMHKKNIKLPFVHPDVTVLQKGYTINVKTSFGLKIIWDGDSYLEVSLPPAFRKSVCGLCGNFNDVEDDDFIGRDGQHYLDANGFGQSWQAGGKKNCKPSGVKQTSPCENSLEKRLQAEKECSLLKSPVFESCFEKVSPGSYFRSCVADLCDCPDGGNCACEAFKAYARACSRQGEKIKWGRKKICRVKKTKSGTGRDQTPGAPGSEQCPRGAVYSACASQCPRTCQNLHKKINCREICRPGCECPTGKVLRGKKCVKPIRCKQLKPA